MSAQWSCIGYPWIIDAIAKYKGGIFTPKAAPAQVVEFLKMPEHLKKCQYSGAIVHISDRKYYIRAIITEEAHETMEREDEHFTLANIKNKIIILKKFTLSFSADIDISRCEFILTIHHFFVMPMVTDTVDLLNCNMEPNVSKKIKELWQNHMNELRLKDTMSDMSSLDGPLTQLLMVANEEKLNYLKSLAEQCLDLELYATQDVAPQARTMWSMERRKNKNHSASFSVPINILTICPEEEAALEQMPEFTANNNTADSVDDSSVEDNASTQYSTAASNFSQESMVDACISLNENPWNNLLFPCATGSAESAILDSSKSVTLGSCEKDTGLDSDPTPDICKDNQDKCMHISSESLDDSPSLLSPRLQSHGIVPEAEASTSTHVPRAFSSKASLPSNKMKLVDTSPVFPGLVHCAQNNPEDPSQVHGSPPKTPNAGHKVPQSSHVFHGSERDNDSNSGGNMIRKRSTPRKTKAVKSKQVPEALDTSLSDQEQMIPECAEKPDGIANVSILQMISSVANTSNGILVHECVGKIDDSPSLLSPRLRSHGIVPEAEASTSTHVPRASTSKASLTSNKMKLVDYSLPLASLAHCAQNNPEDPRQVYRSPPKTSNAGQKVPLSSPVSHCSERDNDSKSGGKVIRKSSTPRKTKAVKRKIPEALDTSLSDQEQMIPECVENPDGMADVSILQRISSVANKSNGVQVHECVGKLDGVVHPSILERITSGANKTNGTQPDLTSLIDKGGRTTRPCMEKQLESNHVQERCTETVKATGTSPARKKVPPYKPMLEFVAQPTTLKVSKNCENVLPAANPHTSSTPCKDAPEGVFHGQTSTFQEPVSEIKKTKMTHFDGTSFQYKYKPPSADLRASVNALRMPTELCKWAKTILSDAKGKVP